MSDQFHFDRHYKITWWVKWHETALRTWILLALVTGSIIGASCCAILASDFSYWHFAWLFVPLLIFGVPFEWWFSRHQIPHEPDT